MLKKHRKVLPGVFVVATVLSIIGGGQRFLIRELHLAGDAPRYAPVVFEFSYWYVWAGLIFPVFALSSRLTVTRERWGRSVAVQALLSVLFALVHLAVHSALLEWILPDFSFWQALHGNLIAKVSQRILVYSGIVVGCYAYDFHRRYRQEAIRGLQLESQLALTQLQTLKNQMNPSTIFSVLRSIRSFLRSNVEVADTLTARLGDLLRLSLESSGRGLVPLQQELEMVRALVQMEEIRSQQKISLQMEVDSRAADALIPNAVLPLVTGAFLNSERDHSSQAGSISVQGELIPREGQAAEEQEEDGRLRLTIRKETTGFSTSLQSVLAPLKMRLEEAYEKGFECAWGKDSSCGDWISLTLPLSLAEEIQPFAVDEQSLSAAGLEQLQWEVELRERRFQDKKSGVLPKAGIVIGVWTVIALVQYLQGMVTLGLEGEVIEPFRMALDYAAWYLWALFTPLVLYLARRYPLGVELRNRNLMIHFFISISISIGMVVLYTGWRDFMGLVDSPEEEARLFLRYPYVIDMLVYFAIVGIHEAIRYSRKILEGELRSARFKANLAHAQLQALKMQLHPHFLFNTLNSLSELMHEDATAAESMLDRLQDFLKITMETGGSEEIPLEKELEFLRDYLAIQQMRFQDRLAVDFHIDPGTVSDRVPNLILQPIVENAIRHGIASRPEAGRIEIRSSHENGNLCLQVLDDGPGMSHSSLESLPQTEGVGLSNTRARLAQLYGESHSFDMTNSPMGGLLVTVHIPLRAGREVE